jgi:hypothetical protein
MHAVKHSLGKGLRVARGTFNQIQREALTTYSLDNDEFTVKKSTINHRLRIDTLTNVRYGPVSLTAQIEPILRIQAKYRQEAGDSR